MKSLSKKPNQPQYKQKNTQSAHKSSVLGTADESQLIKANKKGSKEEVNDTGLGLFFI